jgi:hypothetical protein
VDVDEIAPGLWRWTGQRDTIGREVGCVYQEGPDGIVLIDALVPPEDEERFLHALDRDVAKAGQRGVHLLTTVDRHERSSAALADRYGATIHPRDGVLPNGIAAIETGSPGEVAFRLPEHRCLVVGDVLRGDGDRLVAHGASPGFASAVLMLDVERVLVSHGEPVLAGAHEALRAALAQRG